ncbi:carbon dioxide-concentrating mechanism protein CcmK [Trichothermofontia sp.]
MQIHPQITASSPNGRGTGSLDLKPSSGRPPAQPDLGALGLVCTHSFPAIIGTADMMLKSADVKLVGYEKTGSGFCTAIVRGRFADVRLAVSQGAETAKQFEQFVSSLVLPRPLPNLELVLPISKDFARIAAQQEGSRISTHAVGLLETRGFPAMVGAADAMLKSANVQLVGYETIGDGLCTAIVQGRVSDVTIAVEAGMYEAERIGELHAIMVIPRPLEELMQVLPLANLQAEAPQPLRFPVVIKEKATETVVAQLPESQAAPLQMENVPLHEEQS